MISTGPITLSWPVVTLKTKTMQPETTSATVASIRTSRRLYRTSSSGCESGPHGEPNTAGQAAPGARKDAPPRADGGRRTFSRAAILAATVPKGPASLIRAGPGLRLPCPGRAHAAAGLRHAALRLRHLARGRIAWCARALRPARPGRGGAPARPRRAPPRAWPVASDEGRRIPIGFPARCSRRPPARSSAAAHHTKKGHAARRDDPAATQPPAAAPSGSGAPAPVLTPACPAEGRRTDGRGDGEDDDDSGRR